jgi:uroporphyrinogen decarboxylase
MALIENVYMNLTSDLDIENFWKENEYCFKYTEDKPRCAVSFAPDDHWIFEFTEVKSTMQYYKDKNYRDSIHKEVNAATQKYVGKSFFSEDTWVNSPKRIENLFDCEFAYTEGQTPWFEPVTDNIDDFVKILNKAEKTDITEWAFSDEYLNEWHIRKNEGKEMPKLGAGSRGPATIMSSILDVETLFYWMYDYPEIMGRFRDILVGKMIELNTVFREFSGNTDLGWWVTDDNCALFSKRLYKKYCVPVLDKLLEAMAPNNAERYQHSDSAMAHLLDYQRNLGINVVNYGPELDVSLIREKMPEAIIKGHIPPMMLRNESPEVIKERIIGDFEKAGKGGGLEIATAGSLSAGTGVGRMRWLMKLTEGYCRYK